MNQSKVYLCALSVFSAGISLMPGSPEIGATWDNLVPNMQKRQAVLEGDFSMKLSYRSISVPTDSDVRGSAGWFQDGERLRVESSVDYLRVGEIKFSDEQLISDKITTVFDGSVSYTYRPNTKVGTVREGLFLEPALFNVLSPVNLLMPTFSGRPIAELDTRFTNIQVIAREDGSLAVEASNEMSLLELELDSLAQKFISGKLIFPPQNGGIVITASEHKEISNGVFIPMEISYRTFHLEDGKEVDVMLLQIKISEFEAHFAHEPEFFEFSFPPGSTVNSGK